MNENELGLGRRPAVDTRDSAFAALTMTAALPTLPESRYWNTRYWGDQGAKPHCVGYAWAHWLELGPIGHTAPSPIVNPETIYHSAQLVDEWEGERYDGTSVRAGAKVLETLGYVSAYLWATDAQTVMDAVLGVGPVVVGTRWTRDMFRPDEQGLLHDSGSVAGGHAYVIDGASKKRGVVRIRNSWGRTWGLNGRAWLDAETLERLILADGEACLAVEVAET